MSISGLKELNKISYFYTKTQRSDFYISRVKHCYEVTIEEGCYTLEVGFSPVESGRVFVTLLYNRFLEMNKSQEYYKISDITISVGSTVMTCLDSKKSSMKYPNLNDFNTWYASLDSDMRCTDDAANVIVNLGKKPFVNKMPRGFLPFNYGLVNTKYFMNLFRIRCRAQKQFKHITLIIYIILSH